MKSGEHVTAPCCVDHGTVMRSRHDRSHAARRRGSEDRLAVGVHVRVAFEADGRVDEDSRSAWVVSLDLRGCTSRSDRSSLVSWVAHEQGGTAHASESAFDVGHL